MGKVEPFPLARGRIRPRPLVVGKGQRVGPTPTPVQLAWLRRGLIQAGGKLPLFDRTGRRIDPRTIRSCIEAGWAEPWFSNPIKPDFLICKLTPAGRRIAESR